MDNILEIENVLDTDNVLEIDNVLVGREFPGDTERSYS